MKKIILLMVVPIILLYSYVVFLYISWFVTPIVPTFIVSYPQAIGLHLMFSLITTRYTKPLPEKEYEDFLITAITNPIFYLVVGSIVRCFI